MKRFWGWFGLIIYFSILGVAYTYPVVRYMNTGMPFGHTPVSEDRKITTLAEGDYIQLYYYMWLFKDALQGKTPFFKDPYQLNVPEYGLQDEFQIQQFPLSVIYAAFAFLFGNIASFNLLILLSFPLSGLGLYILGLLLTQNRWASLAGATIYALYPYRLAHVLGGQPGAFVHFLIPWILYFYILGLQKKKWVYGLISGLCLMSLGMNDLHTNYYILLFLGGCLVFTPFALQKNSQSDSKAFVEGGEPFFEESIALAKKPFFFPYALIISILGLVLGLFLAWWALRRTEAFWVWAWVPTGVIFLLSFWSLYSALLSWASGLSLERVLKEDALSYIPILMLLIYPVQFWFEVPGLGSHVLARVLAVVIFIKLYHILKFRRNISQRWSISVRWIPQRFFVLMAFAVPVGVLLFWLFYEKFTKLDVSVVAHGRSLAVIRLYSPGLEDLFNRFNGNGEKFIYPGVFASLLAIIGLGMYFPSLRRRFAVRDRLIFAGACFFFLLTYLLSFGPRIDQYFPLYNFFYQNVPHFGFVRVPTRILYLSFLFFSLLSAYGLKVLFQAMGRSSAKVGCLLVIALCYDYWPAQSPAISLMPKEHPVYQYIHENLGAQRLLVIPIWPGDCSWSSLYQYYVSLYRIPMINGYRPAILNKYIGSVFTPLSPMNMGETNEDIWKLLVNWDVKYVLLHEDAFPEKVSSFPAHFTFLRFKDSGFLKLIRRDQKLSLFEVRRDINPNQGPSQLTSPAYAQIEAEHFKKRVGQEIEYDQSSQGKVLYVNDESRKGFWCFGKSKGFPRGSYQAFFRLQGSCHKKNQMVVRIELWDTKKLEIVAQRDLHGRDFENGVFKDFSLNFVVKDYLEVEPRLYYNRNGEVWFDRVSFGFARNPAETYRVEAEDLYDQGDIAEDAQASGQEAVTARKGSAIRDLIFGPYAPFQKGAYVARFRLKISVPTGIRLDERVATLRVTSNYGNRKVAEKPLYVRDFKDSSGYEDFSLDFTAEEDIDLEFPVRFEGHADLWVDKIEISKD